jgi:hypothetical protein
MENKDDDDDDAMSFPKVYFHSSLPSEKKHNKSLLMTRQTDCMFWHL